MSKVMGLVTFRIFPTYMGGQKGVAYFYQYLQAYLPVLLVLSKDNRQSRNIESKNVLLPNKQIYKNLWKTRQIHQIILDQKIDVLIAEHSYAGWLAWLLHRSTGKPFLIHSHNIESTRFRLMNHWWWRLYFLYEGWIHRKAQHNFFISAEDKQFAVSTFKVKASKCSVITYGIEEKKIHKNKKGLQKSLGLDPYYRMLLFNGTLDYQPNHEAVVLLAELIEPALRKWISHYKIIITGNRAPGKLIRKMMANNNIIYAGYVEDIDLYYQAADLFLNPISNDSGVKTKVIEAIANNCTTISTVSGASGIIKSSCHNKIITVEDNNWKEFVDRIVEQIDKEQPDTPASFYETYAWKNIAAAAAATIKEVVNQ